DVGLAYFPPPDAARSAGDNAVRAGCQDETADDPYPGFLNCPFPTGYYHVGGAGQLFDVIQDRPGLLGEVEHTIGTHAIALGASGEDARVVLRTRYTGGYLRRQLAEELLVDYRLVQIGSGAGFDDSCGDDVSCRWLDEHERTIRTRGLAAWIADTWRPGEGVAVDFGLRAESSQIGESVKVRDVLPRLGASWDVLGRGRSRLYAGWGRYAAMLPAGTGERVFAGPTIYQQVNFPGTLTHAVSSSGAVPIADALRGVRVDETLAGLELGAADVARVGVHARHRRLGRTLEDTGGTLAVVGAEPGTAPATRDFTELGASFENAPSAVVHVRFGYAWSRLRGNWPGPYDPVDGFGLYLSSLFDRPPINATGPLPNDQPHRFFAELAGRGRRFGMDLDLGVRAVAASGRPRSIRTIAGQSFLLPRGAGG
ncbi:MAG: TonB-dependent receptor, partial [Deltaproteobacteria bacterium]|nr:TonB-dependent receptor [Kofleriaceae bacterium]